ncbi:MAG TPA: tetratricopeptide repeat protein [Burkholderiaceae bacterium]|nr:tetratricopeptide repeat protein [Burkholderiaceae bacterium]
MATPLDLQEQEQIDELKAFWKQYGNLITWTLTLALAAFAAWNGWNWWQRDQAAKASAMYDELDRAAAAADAARVAQAFGDLRGRYPKTLQAAQGALLAAKVQVDKGKVDDALATLAWLAENAGEDEYRVVARLRAAGLLFDRQQHDKVLEQLAAAQALKVAEFEPLVLDRRGDVLIAQGKKSEAVAAYQAAYQAMDGKLEYRFLIDAKLTALGAAPAASGASAVAK